MQATISMKCIMDMHWQAARICMDMHQAARTCNMDMKWGYAAWTCSLDMQHGHAAWPCMDIGQAAWRYMNMQLAHRWTRNKQHGHGIIWSGIITKNLQLIGPRLRNTGKRVHLKIIFLFFTVSISYSLCFVSNRKWMAHPTLGWPRITYSGRNPLPRRRHILEWIKLGNLAYW
jgi:hypothetical protein